MEKQGELPSSGSYTQSDLRTAGIAFSREKPADLPVQAATKFELLINLKTTSARPAKAMAEHVSL